MERKTVFGIGTRTAIFHMYKMELLGTELGLVTGVSFLLFIFVYELLSPFLLFIFHVLLSWSFYLVSY